MNKTDVKTNFAKAVRWWRDQLGISQEELAERADLHRTYISDIERGARNLSLESISKLAHALEVSVPTLFLSPHPVNDAVPGEPTPQNGHREFVDILLVEDNLNDVEITLYAFKKARFANRIHVSHDGEDALDFIFCRGTHSNRRRAERPQVVLLDLNLPKVSGMEVLRQLKGDKRTKMIPIVILTASQLDGDIAECQRLGAECYITKPVDFHRLSQVTPNLYLNWGLFRSAPTALQ